jgi:hypothetical protein
MPLNDILFGCLASVTMLNDIALRTMGSFNLPVSYPSVSRPSSCARSIMRRRTSLRSSGDQALARTYVVPHEAYGRSRMQCAAPALRALHNHAQQSERHVARTAIGRHINYQSLRDLPDFIFCSHSQLVRQRISIMTRDNIVLGGAWRT